MNIGDLVATSGEVSDWLFSKYVREDAKNENIWKPLSKVSVWFKIIFISCEKEGIKSTKMIIMNESVLSSRPRQLNNHSHLGSPSPSNPYEGQLGQRPTIGPNDS